MTVRFSFSLACAFLAAAFPLPAQSNPNRGLWVGEVTLGAVNEVTVPLDADNIPRAPDPSVPTPTFDAANLRLIIHVDASGRASLLKHVAILARKAGVREKESDLALVTDESLYGAFPPQPATRISSVAFDFGDAMANAAVNEIANRAADAAKNAANANNATPSSVTEAVRSAAAAVVAQADAAAAFTTFLQTHLDAAKVRAIANGGSTDAAHTAAANLKTSSFFGDTRGLDMLDAIRESLAALPPTATQAQREKAALNAAASFAETDRKYDRFLASEMLGDMIGTAAEAAAKAADAQSPKEITEFQSAESGAATAVLSSAHGLGTGEEVAVFGAAVSAYNGIRPVVRIDADRFRIAVPFVAGGPIGGYSASTGIAPLHIESPGHGLATGDRITLRDSLPAYNGQHLVTVIDPDHFSIDVPFESDPASKGSWSVRSGAIVRYEGTGGAEAGVKIHAPGHGLDNGTKIEIRGAGEPSYNGIKTITRIDDDSFSIIQPFAGNPSDKGMWDVPVAVDGFAPPEELPTRIAAPGHGLADGDRIVINGSGAAVYNGEHEVSVIDAGNFSIPILFDPDTGNPAVKGTWRAAAGGQWRKVAPIRTALEQESAINDVLAEASRVQVSAFSDSRATDAVKAVLEAVLQGAALSDSSLSAQMMMLAEAAGREALGTSVPRYAGPTNVPSEDYSALVRSQAYTGSVATVATAAATAALTEKGNLIATPESIRDKALQAAIEALAPVYAAASRALLPQLPMDGDFGTGSGPLTTEIVLPANHPTNPFRHRRHPDHTTGFDIHRKVKLSFLDADAGSSARTGYGVDRISGVYEEEISGLHKPLGPSGNIGLRVRGTFQLHRISLIDTLNGR